MSTFLLRKHLIRNYSIRPGSIEGIGTIYKPVAVYRVSAGKKTYCVKPFANTGKKLRLLIRGLRFLHAKRYRHAPVLYLTRSGAYYFRMNQTIYYVSDWYTGAACNFQTYRHIHKVVSAIAKLHAITRQFPARYPVYRGQSKEYLQTVIKRHHQFLKDLSFLKQTHPTASLTKQLLAHRDAFVKDGETATGILATYLSSRLYQKHECLCHNDLTRFNCLLDDKGIVRLIDFDNCIIGNSLHDLSLLLANTLDWSWHKMRYGIEVYGRKLAWSGESLHTLYACLLLPREVWYVASAYVRLLKKHQQEPDDSLQQSLDLAIANLPRKQRCLTRLLAYQKQTYQT
ncbi:phosphotransferase [Fodinisporobacter ferrooxydans]|uniref:Phosphotransferase n=1 Tax=Fodinisporobacter ferrooxydans TaxID=2901836 RepID=A0ABY4CRR6_9BACL|nr:phosphotransferase [Alicyclobacillaceae bacterium MYW30-H2]